MEHIVMVFRSKECDSYAMLSNRGTIIEWVYAYGSSREIVEHIKIVQDMGIQDYATIDESRWELGYGFSLRDTPDLEILWEKK